MKLKLGALAGLLFALAGLAPAAAQVKIPNLPAATTPLAGTELLPIWQNSQLKSATTGALTTALTNTTNTWVGTQTFSVAPVFTNQSGTRSALGLVIGSNVAPATSGAAILKGNSAGGFASAASGTDYAPATSGSSLLYGNGSGGFSNVTLGAGLSFSAGTLANTVATSGTSLLMGSGSGGLSNVTIGSGLSFTGGTLSAPGNGGTTSNNTWTGTQTFAGTTANIAAILANVAEPVTVSATAATGTINLDLTTQSVVYYTTAASANWTLNARGNGTTTLNTLLSTGQAVTVVFLAQQGATAYYASTIQVDGTTTGVTTYWQGGAAPVAGNASGVDSYTLTIIKTASATYTVLASLTQF